MKIICTDKLSGKRIAISDIDCPNYKNEYNDENGNAFVTIKEVKAPVVKKVVKKRKAKK